jgi:hypothetical protein
MLNLTPPEYFAAATIMGLLAGQTEEPDKKWCLDWALDMGEMMAAGARRRRARKR